MSHRWIFAAAALAAWAVVTIWKTRDLAAPVVRPALPENAEPDAPVRR